MSEKKAEHKTAEHKTVKHPHSDKVLVHGKDVPLFATCEQAEKGEHPHTNVKRREEMVALPPKVASICDDVERLPHGSLTHKTTKEGEPPVYPVHQLIGEKGPIAETKMHAPQTKHEKEHEAAAKARKL